MKAFPNADVSMWEDSYSPIIEGTDDTVVILDNAPLASLLNLQKIWMQ